MSGQTQDVQATSETGQGPGYAFGTKVLMLFGSIGLVAASAVTVGTVPTVIGAVGVGVAAYTLAARREQAELAKLAEDLQFTLKALKDPPGATKSELAGLAVLRDSVNDATSASPLSRTAIDAAFRAVDDLDHQIKQVKEAATNRELPEDPAQKEAEARQDKLLGLITKLRLEARQAAAQTTARTRAGLEAWEKLLKSDDEELDPDAIQPVLEARDGVLAEFADYQAELSGLWDQVFDEPDEVGEDDIIDAAKQAHLAVEKKDLLLTAQLKEVEKRAGALDAEQKARLTNNDELRLTNRFSNSPKKPTRKAVEACLLELRPDGAKIPAKMLENAMDFLDELGGDASEVQKAKASKQKPYAVIHKYLTATDPLLVPIYESAMGLMASDLVGKGLDNVAKLARELVRIASPSRDTNRWLVRLYLQGTTIAGLQRFYDNRALLEGLPISGALATKLTQQMANPGFDVGVFARLDGKRGTRPAWFFPAAVKTLMRTDSEDLATKVIEDDYGLHADARPGNSEEPKIARGMDDGVVAMNQRATTKSAIHGPGYAFLFSYVDGHAAMYELHVHIKPGTNYHPAWKRCSAPRERVEGRAYYTIAPALKAKLG